MKFKFKDYFCAISCALFVTCSADSLKLHSDTVDLSLNPTENGIELVASVDGNDKLVSVIGLGIDFSNVSCTNTGRINCATDNALLVIDKVDSGYAVSWETNSTSVQFRDCYDLKVGTVNWYGGPERWSQKWPIEKLTLTEDEAYVIKRSDNFGVAERYWLNSLGAYIFIDETAPLFVDQNNEEEGKVCFIAKAQDPYVNRERVFFNYTLIVNDDPKEAHLHAINNYLGKPSGHPDSRMIEEPIWTTWAKYKRDIDDDTVISFAQNILDHGFAPGQIEIDDDWERCYGAQEFKSDIFSNINGTVSKLKELGFRVTLWIHPFVNDDCQDVSSVGLEEGYFVKNASGSTAADWWDGSNAHQIDFTNPDAAEWFTARLKKLQKNPGIDSFKFDAGETNYGPKSSVYDLEDNEKLPNAFTEDYLRTCAEFGNLIEARSAWRTQDLPIFTRMLDKDSVWNENNGLFSLITTLLQMNMNGYPMVLPDMIGGNGYSFAPSVELIIRWTQANTFMPAMQFSYLPWDYADDEINSTAIVARYVNLHKTYSSDIIKAMEASVKDGTPVNPPIWWVDPTDAIALATNDEYLLGEQILVAPIITEGATSRNVYLPKGSWKDGNTEKVYTGPITLNDYPVPLDTLPFFILN